MSTNNLPSEYQEVEYVESTGTQWVDTNFIPNGNTRVVISAQLPNQPEDSTAIFGQWYSSNYYRVFWSNSRQSMFLQYGNTGITADFPYTSNVMHIDLNKNNLYIDDVLRCSATYGTITTDRHILLFMSQSANVEWLNRANVRIYSCEIYDNGTLVRNYIPCYRKADSEIGLYDIVNDVFYTNAGSGTFLKGSDIISEYPVHKVKANLLRGEPARIPSEYQEVEYIASSGTQYINTGVNLSSSDTVKCKFEMMSATESLADAIYGAYDNPNFFVLLMRSPTQARVGTSSNQASSTNYSLNTIYDTSLTNGTYIENGTTYTFTPHTGFTNLPSCYIMFRNQTGASVVPVSAKVYSFEIVGKFNGIPCYRKSDNEIGLYDTVNGVFYTNAGSGNFNKGSNVNSGYITNRVKVNMIKNQTIYKRCINLINVS